MGEALGGTYAKADMGCKREGDGTARDAKQKARGLSPGLMQRLRY